MDLQRAALKQHQQRDHALHAKRQQGAIAELIKLASCSATTDEFPAVIPAESDRAEEFAAPRGALRTIDAPIAAEAAAAGNAAVIVIADVGETAGIRERAARLSWPRFLTRGAWPLAGILLLQAGLSLRLMWSNTAFNDEALYLWSGHWEIAHLLYGIKIPPFQTYFSGSPVIYPVIGAVADSYGGLAAARLLSLAFMLGATTLCYLTGRRLFGHKAGIIAAALFAVLGPVQFLGAFATYDAMALFLLAAATCLVVVARGWWSEPALIAAALILALADATKYATTLWDPIVLVAVGLAAGSGNWHRDTFRALRFLVYLAAPLALALHLGGQDYLHGLLFTTLSRAPGQVPALTILRESALWVGLVVLIAMRSVVVAFDRRERLLCAAFVLAGFLAPLEQARIHTGASIEKHVAFGAWFAAVAAGYVLRKAVVASKYARWRIVGATVAALLLFGFVAANNFYAAWPNTQQAATVMARAIRATPGPILAEQKSAFDYDLRLSPYEAYGPNGFYWWDAALGHEFTGTAAYVQAIHAHFFAVVEVDGSFSINHFRDGVIMNAIRDTPGYKLVASIPWEARVAWKSTAGRGTFKIWRYEGNGRS